MPKSTEKLKTDLLNPYELQEITKILIKHEGLHEGHYGLGIEFSYAIGPVELEPGKRMPGGLFGVKRMGLVLSDVANPSTVDAATVNPAKPLKTRPSKTPVTEI